MKIKTQRWWTGLSKLSKPGVYISKILFTVCLFSFQFILYHSCETNRMASDICLQSPAWQRKQLTRGTKYFWAPLTRQPTKAACVFHYCINPQCILGSDSLTLASSLFILLFFLQKSNWKWIRHSVFSLAQTQKFFWILSCGNSLPTN